MPRSRNPETYPKQYSRLLETVRGQPDGMTIEFDNQADMMRTRSSLYAYINALAYQEDEMNIEWEYRKSPEFRQVMLKPVGKTLHLLNKAYTPEALCIDKALNKVGAVAPLDTITDDTLALAQAAIDEATSADSTRDDSMASAEPIVVDKQADLISNLFNPKGK